MSFESLGPIGLRRTILSEIYDNIDSPNIFNVIKTVSPQFLLFSFFVLICSFYLFHSYVLLEPRIIAGFNDFLASTLSYLVYISMSFLQVSGIDLIDYYIYISISFLTIASTPILTSYLGEVWAQSRYRSYTRYIYKDNASPAFWYYSVSAFSFFVLVGGLFLPYTSNIYSNISHQTDNSDQDMVLVENKTLTNIPVPNGRGGILNRETEVTIRTVDITEANSASDLNLQSLISSNVDKLTVNNRLLNQISLYRWNNLRHLIIQGDSVHLDPDDSSQSVTTLEVLGGYIRNFSSIDNMYPMLATLSVKETSIPYPEGLPELWKGALVHIDSEGPPMLTWLHTSASSYLFEFSHPPTEKSRNLPVLRYLSVPADGLDPDVVREMTNLKWLYVRNSSCTENTTSSDERKWCREMNEIDSERSLNIEYTEEKETLFSKRADLLTVGL